MVSREDLLIELVSGDNVSEWYTRPTYSYRVYTVAQGRAMLAECITTNFITFFVEDGYGEDTVGQGYSTS